ncbi:MAG: DUF4407 domain-containing protein [Verrucomicrobiota bacterium]
MQQPFPTEPETTTYQPARWDRWMRPLYWMAGARWETLRHCPPSERERIAVLGSTVLIPTVMSFLGMIFYAKSRFASPPWVSVLAIAVAWSFVIMNTDRILLATYRPFQPWWRRCMQVLFRFALSAVVSVAISFPFCLDQYRPAITYRLQTELQGKLNTLREEEAGKRAELAEELQKIRDDEAASRKQLVASYTSQHDALVGQLPALETAILNPEEYADKRVEDERRRAGEPDFVAPASGETRNVLASIEAQKETLAKTKSKLEEKQDLHNRLVEAIARESNGLPNEFYPEPKKAGSGPRTKDMMARDKAVNTELRRLDSALTLQQEGLLAGDKQLAAARLEDRNAYLDALVGKRDAFIEEGLEKERIRKERLAKLQADIAAVETAHPLQLTRLANQTAALEATHASNTKRHEERYLPHIQRIERKMNGVLDPMEETIGLYRVIFLPAPDADLAEKAEQPQKWIAGLFQFLVIFGTLFVLDLVPIMTKIFSRAGPYDVLVEHPEFIANANLRVFHTEYGKHSQDWGVTGMVNQPSGPDLVKGNPRHVAQESVSDS